jgi:uncharacterized protein YjbI with pentapeptide repeats
VKFQIKNRFSGAVQFECELGAEFEALGYSVQLGAAVKVAIKSRADLSGANLSGADLSGANLSRADLSRANLSGADLSGANLSGANLSRANLSGAKLSGAKLSRANLSGADLSGANLSGADLSGANLSRADLSRADLCGANLSGANGQKLTVVGERPVFWLGPIGREQRTITAWRTDAGVYVRAGCFWDTLDNFKAAITETHGDNEHGREYAAAVVMIEAHFEVWK